MVGGSRSVLRGSGVEFVDVEHAGAKHRVEVRRVATARRLTLRVRAAKRDVILTMPARGSLLRAKLFVQRHAAWIDTRLARLPTATPFGPGAIIPLRGVPHEITHRPGMRGLVWIEDPDPAAPDGTVALPRLCVAGDAPFVARRVQAFLTKLARADLELAVARHTAKLGVAAQRITLRDTTSRWGSCSSAGALSFSWRLIMAPPLVLDYLAAHEVAHLRHMNHSDAFWATCAALMPDHRRAEAWLKAHGLALLRFGALGRAAG